MSAQCRADAAPQPPGTEAICHPHEASVKVRAMPPLPPHAEPGRRATATGAAVTLQALAGVGLVSFTLLLGGCGSAPRTGRDGPPPSSTMVPPEASRRPDAEPRVEPLRAGGPNKPYEVLGRGYVPQTRDVPMRETGIASWYGRQFDGRRTASGEVFDMNAMSAAHKTMPLPSYARVRNPANGREVVVRVNDRGPFVDGRIIDLSYAAAVKLGVAGGIAPVEVERLTFEDIRTGAWRRGDGGSPAPEPTPVVVAAARTPVASPVTSPAAMPAQPPAPASAPARATPTAPAISPAATRDSAPDPAPESGLAFAIALMGGGTESGSGKEPPATPPSGGATTPAPRGFWIQLGAFRERPGAESFQQRIAADLDWLAPRLAVFDEAPLLRLQAGPYASREEAQSAAQRVREALQLVPLVVERR